MRAATIITLSSGNEYGCVDFPSKVHAIVEAARTEGVMASLETTRIPTGQFMWLAPEHVLSIRPGS